MGRVTKTSLLCAGISYLRHSLSLFKIGYVVCRLPFFWQFVLISPHWIVSSFGPSACILILRISWKPLPLTAFIDGEGN